MNTKIRFKLGVDLIMSVLFLLSLAYPFTGNFPHEILGTALGICFILHNVLNIGWYASLLKGKYTPFRGVLTLVNLLLLGAMIGLCVTGIFLSREVFSFLELGGSWTARRLHSVFAYWGFILSAIHLGLNGGIIKPHLVPLQRIFPKWTVRLTAWLAAGYGFFAFFYWKAPAQLGLFSGGIHIPRGRSFISFLTAHAAILFLTSVTVYLMINWLSHKKTVLGGNIHA